MQQVLINTCYGGFGLTKKASDRFNELSGKEVEYCFDIERDDPFLIQTFIELGEKCNDIMAELKLVEFPVDVQWIIVEYDGVEHVAEKHRTWY